MDSNNITSVLNSKSIWIWMVFIRICKHFASNAVKTIIHAFIKSEIGSSTSLLTGIHISLVFNSCRIQLHRLLLHYNAAFKPACCSPHCRFDDDICTTAQVPLATEGWPSGKQRHANRSITLPLCPPRQIADRILFNSGAMLLGDKAKAALSLRAATLKQQAMITRRSGKVASSKLVWNQHKTEHVTPLKKIFTSAIRFHLARIKLDCICCN